MGHMESLPRMDASFEEPQHYAIKEDRQIVHAIS